MAGRNRTAHRRAGGSWITPAEARNFDITPTTLKPRLHRPAGRRLALLTIESFGHTAQGRELYAVRAAKPGRSSKPILFAQAGIHAGD